MSLLKRIVIVFGMFALYGIYEVSRIRYDVERQYAVKAYADRKARPDRVKALARREVREACAKHEDWDIESCRAVDARKVAVGMTAEQARLAWGKPETINNTITQAGRSEQWVYSLDQILYVENGVVRSMQLSH